MFFFAEQIISEAYEYFIYLFIYLFFLNFVIIAANRTIYERQETLINTKKAYHIFYLMYKNRDIKKRKGGTHIQTDR